MRIHCIVFSLVAAAVVGCGDDFLAPIPDGPTTQSNFRLHATYGWVTSIWGDASGEVLALNGSALLRYDGEDWHRTYGLHNGSPVDIWGSSPSDLFAVGGNGTINHYDGMNWTTMPSPTGKTLNAVWGSGPEDVYAVGEYSTLLHYDGVRWSPVSVPAYKFPQHFRDVWGSSGSDVFALGHSLLLHYDGSEWSPFHEIGGSVLWGTGDHLFVGQRPREGVVAHYDGISWSDLDTGTDQRFLAAWGSSANDVYFVGRESVMHWDGSTWTESLRIPLYDGYLPAVLCIWGRDASDVFIGGEQFLHYDGSRWSPVLNLISPVQEVCVISESEFITFGSWYGDEMFLYDGAEWNSLGEFNGDMGGAAGSPSEVFIVGTDDNDGDDDGDGYDDGYISRFVPGVARWPQWWWAPRGLGAVWVDSGTDGFAVGAGGIVLRYDGFAWQEMPSPTTSTLSAVWGSSGHDVFAAGRDGYALEILHYDGSSWRVMLRQESSDFYSRIRIWGSSNRDVYLGSRDFFLHYDGTSWKPVDLGGSFPVSDLWGRSESDVYVSGANGIRHYDGKAWTPLDLGEPRGLGGRIWGTADALFTTGVEGVYRLDQE